MLFRPVNGFIWGTYTLTRDTSSPELFCSWILVVLVNVASFKLSWWALGWNLTLCGDSECHVFPLTLQAFGWVSSVTPLVLILKKIVLGSLSLRYIAWMCVSISGAVLSARFGIHCYQFLKEPSIDATRKALVHVTSLVHTKCSGFALFLDFSCSHLYIQCSIISLWGERSSGKYRMF